MSNEKIDKKIIKEEFLKVINSIEKQITKWPLFENYEKTEFGVINKTSSKINKIIDENGRILTDFLNQDYEYIYNSDDFLNGFLEASEKMNNNLFWTLWGTIFSRLNYVSRHQEQMLSMITDKRLEMSLYQRNLNVSYLTCPMTSFEKLILRLDDYEDDYKMKVYRGFNVRPDRQIKDGDKQVEGRGMSYTMDKSVSKEFGLKRSSFWGVLHYFTHLTNLQIEMREKGELKPELNDIEDFIRFAIKIQLEKHNMSSGGVDGFSHTDFMNDKEVRNKLFDTTIKDNRFFTNFRKTISLTQQEKLQNEKNFYETTFDTDKMKSWFGTYEIKKKDIIICLNRMMKVSNRPDNDEENEYEVVIDPKNVKMLRYEVINFKNIDFFKQ